MNIIKNLIKKFLLGKSLSGERLSLKEGLRLKYSLVPKEFEENFPDWDRDDYDTILYI